MNASEQIQLTIEVIQAVKQQFQDTHIIDILTGNKSTSVVKFKHNKLKQFGEGEEYDVKFWRGVIRVALFEELIYKDIAAYPNSAFSDVHQRIGLEINKNTVRRI